MNFRNWNQNKWTLVLKSSRIDNFIFRENEFVKKDTRSKCRAQGWVIAMCQTLSPLKGCDLCCFYELNCLRSNKRSMKNGASWCCISVANVTLQPFYKQKKQPEMALLFYCEWKMLWFKKLLIFFFVNLMEQFYLCKKSFKSFFEFNAATPLKKSNLLKKTLKSCHLLRFLCENKNMTRNLYPFLWRFILLISLFNTISSRYMSYFAYACKTEGKNGISRLISELLRTLDSSLRDRLFVLQNEVFWTT